MNWYKKSQVENLSFENNHINYHHQQNDYNLLAKIGDQSVGIIEYSEYNDEIYINNILVSPQLRRQKIATRMFEELKRINHNMPIHWGLMTDEGYKLKQSLEESSEVINEISALVKKIKLGNKDWTNDELQLQQNYPRVIERLLKQHVASSGYYKKYSQQIELGLGDIKPPNRSIKTDPYSIDHIIKVVASMLFDNEVPDEKIKNILKDLKNLKEQGIIKFPIGIAIRDRFDKVCGYLNILDNEKVHRKKMAFDRLRKIMEELV